MSSADEYYEYVEQCITLASVCVHPGDKARLLQMAKAWRELAEKLDASQNSPVEDSAAFQPRRAARHIADPGNDGAVSPGLICNSPVFILFRAEPGT